MTISDIGSIGEFVAAVATIVTLLYLAAQIRFNSKVAQAAVQQESADSYSEFSLRMAQDPELRGVLIRSRDKSILDELSDDDSFCIDALYRALFNGANRDFMNFKLGICSEEYWNTVKAWLERGLLEDNPIIWDWWDKRVVPISSYHEEFRTLISDEIERKRNAMND